MSDPEARALWGTVQEFIGGLQRQDPTVRRWIAPQSEAELLLDLYGEQALLILLKDYLEKEQFILVRTGTPPGEAGPVRLAEIAWTDLDSRAHTPDDLVTLRLRLVRRKWQVEDLWPAAMDAPLTVDQARLAYASQEGPAGPAILFLAGALEEPPEGTADLDDVETLFVLGMDAHGYSPREVTRAVRLWRDYRGKARPSYRKPAVFAAAVEYAFALLGQYRDTQQRVASYYGVAPTSLVARFNDLRECLNLVYFDPRYSAFGEAPAELRERCLALGIPWPAPLKRFLDSLVFPPRK
jgi:hypothetical protein